MARKTTAKTQNNFLNWKLEVDLQESKQWGDSLGTSNNYNQESIKITNVLLIHNLDMQHLQQITYKGRKEGRKDKKKTRKKTPQKPKPQKLTFT